MQVHENKYEMLES